MGRITRTQFGCTKTIEITNAEIITASDDGSLLAVPGIPGKIMFPLCAFLRFDWVADLADVDAGGFLALGVLPLSDGNLTLFQIAGTAQDIFAPGESIAVPFGIQSDATDWVDSVSVLDLATFGGQGLYFSIDNNAAGPYSGGDPLNKFTLETHYMVI